MLGIKAPRRVVLGIHEKCTNTGMFGNAEGAQDGVAQKATTKPPPLVTSVHGKPREHHHRDGVPGQTLLCARRGGNVIDTSCGEAIVARHTTLIVRHDECSRGARLLVLHGIAAQPLIENLHTAIELADMMLG